jgi:hypothetical protein
LRAGWGSSVRTIYPGAQGWDQELLALELQGLIDLKFEVELTGFSLAEIDLVRGCPQRRDCVAGVGGLEIQPNSGFGDIRV